MIYTLNDGADYDNPISHEYFKTGVRKAFHGLCLVVAQAKYK